ncbi:rab-like protein 3 [Arctopsyche grandis]|uniref:rab-like protein 3 n=1 Tax=Arctopsyche grandis TaxID=121162 RepID=UPI00406D721C
MSGAVSRVKILVAGDSGVGKTALADRISSIGMKFFTWTIGCSVSVKLHTYKQGTPEQNTYFIELYDIGGSNHHKESRSVFYQSTHGIILVHDLTNRKSQLNLQRWLAEILSTDGDGLLPSSSLDSEQFVGTTQIPIFVVGTKWDLIDDNLRKRLKRTPCSIAEQCGGDEIYVSLNNMSAFAPGSTNAVKLSRFFDKVIERHHYSRDISSPFSDKKKTILYSPPFTTPPSAYSPPSYTKFYHKD